MVKEPVAGRTKTRLAREVGVGRAIRFARASAAALFARVGHDTHWQTTLAVTPDAALCSRTWPHCVSRMAQGPGDLGARMQHIFARLPPGPVVIVGTDIPAITPRLIADAFRRLGQHDAVFGPAADGGYWLVGFKRRPHLLRAFARVRWSTPHALADSLANLAGLRIARVATLRDVDDADSLTRAAGTFGRRVLPAR